MYFLDTCAMIGYLENLPKYVKIIDNNKFFVSKFQLMELYYISLRENGKELAEKHYDAFSRYEISIPETTIKNAMQLRLKLQNQNLKASYVDIIGYQYALENKLKFITSDTVFKKLRNVEFVAEK